MSLDLRTVRDDEMTDFLRAVGTGFGMLAPDEDDEYPVHLLPADRCLFVRDGETIVATAGAVPFRVTVPGGARVPMAGVSTVTVHPTHRRRGLLRRMMDEQLDDVARRGEPLAALTASEASIYERFGYGTATFSTRWELASDYATARAAEPVPGAVRLVDGEAAAAVVHSVYERIPSVRVGELERPAEWWNPIFRPGPRGARFFTAVHDGAAGQPDAFVRYALDADWVDGVPNSRLRVKELQAVDADAEAALWTFLFGIDLVTTIAVGDRPVDDPLRWRLPDARRLRVRELRDHLWVRIVDVPAAMSARTYGTDDALVVELTDDFRPANSGCWLVDGGADGASCTRTDRGADVALGAAELGAVYLGGVPVSTLAAAGRVRELTSGAIARADRFLLVHPAPWCTTHF